jgi:uncharacterized UPF0160 family protein
MKTLITHSGSFHADDLFAYAVLSQMFPAANLVRTRDMDLIRALEAEAIVFDIGDIYDPEARRFDHHQNGRPLRDEGLAYSSFGLIWKHYGMTYLQEITGLDEEDAAFVHATLDRTLVRDIDAIDNGDPQPDQAGITHAITLPRMIMDFRPDFDDDDADEDQGFKDASEICALFLSRRIGKVAAGLRSRQIVEAAIANKPHPNWIELPRGMNYLGAILDSGDTDIQYVVNPSGPDEWQINAVNTARGTYDLRRDLPTDWAGLRGEKLAQVTGVSDAVFCHMNLFIAVARTRAGAMAMLDQALSSPS